MQKTSWPPAKPLFSTHMAYVQRECEPGRPCQSCGIYALAQYADVVEHQRFHGWRELGSARGVVAGWGRVHLCSRGWRAGKAYPLALLDWVTPPEILGGEGLRWHTVLHLVAERYGIPVVASVDDLEEVARSQGVAPLSEWLRSE